MPVTAQTIPMDFQALAGQLWEAWTRQTAGPAAAPPPLPGMDGFASYLAWMQQAAAAMTGQGTPPPSPAASFAGLSMPGMASAPAGLDALRGLLNTPTFGYTREQQAGQQAFLRALLDHQQASARYHELLARAQAQGAERMQRKLAEPGFQVESLKAMYDLWVDAVEEAYAEIALSDEFREAYAAHGNTQMRVRQLQQQQLEQWCREAGLPTRSEVDTLGQRVQELRRELRRVQQADRQAAPAAAVKTSRAASAGAQAKARSTAKPKPKPAAKPKPDSAARSTAGRTPRKTR